MIIIECHKIFSSSLLNTNNYLNRTIKFRFYNIIFSWVNIQTSARTRSMIDKQNKWLSRVKDWHKPITTGKRAVIFVLFSAFTNIPAIFWITIPFFYNHPILFLWLHSHFVSHYLDPKYTKINFFVDFIDYKNQTLISIKLYCWVSLFFNYDLTTSFYFHAYFSYLRM